MRIPAARRFAITVLAAGAILGAAPVAYAVRAGAAATTPAIAEFGGAAAVSSSSAWAVGDWSKTGTTYKSLIEHWNGSSWKIQASPSPGDDTNALRAAAASSATNAWAVGDYHTNGQSMKTLVEHWNGSSWKLQRSPSPVTGNNILAAVTASSRTNVWAVGYTMSTTGAEKTLIEHWNGTSWRVQASPNPGSSNELTGVSALSKSDVWATGYLTSSDGTQSRTLIEHWNGSSWKVVASPNPGVTYNYLCGMTAVSRSDAWAAGTYIQAGTGYQEPLMEHWDGRSWRVHASAASPPGWEYDPCTMTATAAGNVWAAGSRWYLDADHTLVEHWNGSTWKVQKTVNPATGDMDQNVLNGVAAVSARNAWAAGMSYVRGSGHRRPLIEHWNGYTWKVQRAAVPGA